MKLYTEQQLEESYKRGLMDGRLNNIDYSITDGFKPIELPSDEEIIEVAIVVYGFNAKDIKEVLEYKAFKRGAKWMRNKILNK